MNVKIVPLDAETRVRDEDHVALKTWLRLLTCATLMEGELRSRFRTEFDCTLPRFDLMAQLERHPKGLAMGQLKELMMVSGGNVTGLVNQLEEQGWVQRFPDADDRRSHRVRLTDDGARAFARMAQVHESWVVELLAGMSEKEQDALLLGLRRLKKSFHAAVSQP